MTPGPQRLTLRRLGIDTYQQPVLYMHRDCAVCRAEGFESQSRVAVSLPGRALVATLNVVLGDWLAVDEAGLSESAWRRLAPGPRELAVFSHPEPARSASILRAKVFGHRLGEEDYRQLMEDAVASRLSDLELAAFVTACAGERLDLHETIALTRAMVGVGERLDWGRTPVLDKHCVGGLPGNRTTPIVVAIVAAAGHWIPKTSSRAITSPAGTADAMATIAPVDLDLAAMRRVVEREGGCIVWGGSVGLSPADDVLIRVERPLDFDSDAQLVSSVLSKKLAAGTSDVLIDVPVGPTAKVRDPGAARALKERLVAVGAALGLRVNVHMSDGTQPVGRGIGPALEGRDAIAVLRCDPTAAHDLRTRALDLAGHVLAMVPGARESDTRRQAEALLDDGSAWRKFVAICEAQGGFSEPPTSSHRHEISASRDAVVTGIDNRRLGRLAKLAGAPRAAAAGLERHIALGQRVRRGDTLLTLHAESVGEIEYALEYFDAQTDLIALDAVP